MKQITEQGESEMRIDEKKQNQYGGPESTKTRTQNETSLGIGVQSTQRKIFLKNLRSHVVFVLMFIAGSWGAIDAIAQPIECSSSVQKVTAVTDPAGHVITTKFQVDVPNLQTLLTTTINARRGCLVAHLSGLARITDNYIVFQVRVDGVPMQGHLSSVAGIDTPAVFVSIDALSDFPLNDEQFIDPTKVVAYNFFNALERGTHTIEVLAAAGSGIDSLNAPRVDNLVLTLEYR